MDQTAQVAEDFQLTMSFTEYWAETFFDCNPWVQVVIIRGFLGEFGCHDLGLVCCLVSPEVSQD